MRFSLPRLAFLMLVRCTFMMTEPSFRCRFTFLPMNDLALFKLKFSMFVSPFLFFFGYVGPALFADGYFFAVEHYVQFDVFAVAFVFPGVFAVFQLLASMCSHGNSWFFYAFKVRSEATVACSGGRWVKVKKFLLQVS